MTKIRVLVVDDSAFMRKMVSDLLSEDPSIEVIEKAKNGMEGVNKVKELAPDVVTLDIEMPVMNGLDALQYLMKNHPVPVVMLSSLTQEGASETIRALELGAVDFVPKPSGAISLDIHKVQEQLVQKVKAASRARINRTVIPSTIIPKSEPKISASYLAKKNENNVNQRLTTKGDSNISNIILVGTSTGGPKALQTLLTSIPANIPGAILIVQHMPPGFTKSLSQRLDSLCAIRVCEAEDGMPIETGMAYIAPGDFHMELKKSVDGRLLISLNKNEPRGGHRPSVDTLFESAARIHHRSKYAIIMTGMGSDGTKGMEALKSTGCKESIAEDESTCVVFGMPRAAIQSGKIDRVLPLHQIGPYLAKELNC
ncbi:MAG TPA: chemotaxis response regulator protein-glutamate methylesterase [Bacillota bacterium]|nr:chemotaxis response regulator protein-glutamate methylesterase [Bacillota bacterium]